MKLENENRNQVKHSAKLQAVEHIGTLYSIQQQSDLITNGVKYYLT